MPVVHTYQITLYCPTVGYSKDSYHSLQKFEQIANECRNTFVGAFLHLILQYEYTKYNTEEI